MNTIQWGISCFFETIFLHLFSMPSLGVSSLDLGRLTAALFLRGQ